MCIHAMKISDGLTKLDGNDGSNIAVITDVMKAETTMFRFKTIFGGTLRRRRFDNQAVELFLKCAALNRMIQLGKPDSYKVEK